MALDTKHIKVEVKVVPYTFVRRGVPVREDTYPEPSACEVYDIKDHMRPIARRKPDCIIVHCGTNDLTKKAGIDTLETIREMIT